MKLGDQKVSNKSKNKVDNYEHSGVKRLNNPPVGLVNKKTALKEEKRKYKFDPHLDPLLQWSGKEEKEDLTIQTVSLHTHERIDPKSIIDVVKSEKAHLWEQMNLFDRPINKLDFIKEVQFYKHEKDWVNRMIAGDSLLVMNSLLERENMAEKVQTIYFDPPYGINYSSNFQPFVNKREVKDKDSDLTSEPEMLYAFRDTWELGIHSYLAYIKDRLFLMKELLHDTGSIFFQISDKNMHYARMLLDEVFGTDNFIVTIPFKKKGNQKSGLMKSINDYILWYGKNSKNTKYNPYYVKREFNATTIRDFKNVQIDNEVYKISAVGPNKIDYRNNPKQLFKDYPQASIFKTENATGGGVFRTQIQDIELDNRVFKPGKNKSWKVSSMTEDGSLSGMERLKLANRLIAGKTQIGIKRFFEDFPYQQLTNWWDNVGGAANPIYVVQTSDEIVQRCISMASDPGDIVFDPTCGSGVTSYIAEKLGRRWITCDTSRVALTLAKQRLLTSFFDYYKLEDPREGPKAGFICKKVPHVTAGSIANNPFITKSAKITDTLLRKSAPVKEIKNLPIQDSDKVRVTGPFTFEAVPAPTVLENEAILSYKSTQDWTDELLKSKVRITGKKYLRFKNLNILEHTRFIHADGLTDEKIPQRVVVSFGPEHAPLEKKQIEEALMEAEKIKPSPTVLIFAALQFDPEAAKLIDEIEWTGVTILKVQMNADLFTEDLKKKRSSNDCFWLIGKPDIKIEKDKTHKGKIKVSVSGFDYYNPSKGTVESGGEKKISMWMLDTNYDNRSLLPRQIFFPMAGKKDGWAKIAKTLNTEIDQDLIQAYWGTTSVPFEIGSNKRIAVKIIDDRGIESLVVKDV